MDERIKEAFEQVQAESGLKDRTKAYVSRKTGSYRRAGTAKYKVLASASVSYTHLTLPTICSV